MTAAAEFCVGNWMAIVLEIGYLTVCRKIHGWTLMIIDENSWNVASFSIHSAATNNPQTN